MTEPVRDRVRLDRQGQAKLSTGFHELRELVGASVERQMWSLGERGVALARALYLGDMETARSIYPEAPAPPPGYSASRGARAARGLRHEVRSGIGWLTIRSDGDWAKWIEHGTAPVDPHGFVDNARKRRIATTYVARSKRGGLYHFSSTRTLATKDGGTRTVTRNPGENTEVIARPGRAYLIRPLAQEPGVGQGMDFAALPVRNFRAEQTLSPAGRFREGFVNNASQAFGPASEEAVPQSENRSAIFADMGMTALSRATERLALAESRLRDATRPEGNRRRVGPPVPPRPGSPERQGYEAALQARDAARQRVERAGRVASELSARASFKRDVFDRPTEDTLAGLTAWRKAEGEIAGIRQALAATTNLREIQKARERLTQLKAILSPSSTFSTVGPGRRRYKSEQRHLRYELGKDGNRPVVRLLRRLEELEQDGPSAGVQAQARLDAGGFAPIKRYRKSGTDSFFRFATLSPGVSEKPVKIGAPVIPFPVFSTVQRYLDSELARLVATARTGGPS